MLGNIEHSRQFHYRLTTTRMTTKTTSFFRFLVLDDVKMDSSTSSRRKRRIGLD